MIPAIALRILELFRLRLLGLRTLFEARRDSPFILTSSAGSGDLSERHHSLGKVPQISLRYFSSNQKTAPRDMSGSVNTVLSPDVLP